MRTIRPTGVKTRQRGNNKYYIYTVTKLSKSGLIISPKGDRLLKRIVLKGANKAGLSGRSSENNSKFSDRTSWSSSNHNSTQFRRNETLFYSNLDKLVAELINIKQLNNQNQIITSKDIRTTLRKLCPIWPIC